MASKHDEFKVYNFLFTGGELDMIVQSLLASGYEELAEEILEEIHSDQEEFEATENIASLTFDIDTSGVKEATEELGKLEQAARSLADAYDRLHDAQKGPVEYSPDATERLIKELMAGVVR